MGNRVKYFQDFLIAAHCSSLSSLGLTPYLPAECFGPYKQLRKARRKSVHNFQEAKKKTVGRLPVGPLNHQH